MKTIALIGNPNSGKTSLFNNLTGLLHHVGNWPGKTVEKKEGKFEYRGKPSKVIDLPGTYDLLAPLEEESIVKDFVSKGNYDILVNIVDCSSLERSLHLTIQLLELGIPLIVALNFSGYSKKKGQKLDSQKLSALLGVPVVEMEAIGDTSNLKEAVVNFKKLHPAIKPSGSARERYGLISSILSSCMSSGVKPSRSDAIDKVLLNKWTGFPIYLLILFMVFQVTYTVAQPFMDMVDGMFSFFSMQASQLLGAQGLLSSFVTEGIIAGIGSILVFLPTIMFLYLMLAILEDSGYLCRAAYLMDSIMSRIGLRGYSFIPLVLGFGCNVPAIMATRTIRGAKERLMTILMIPYMACSARLAVFIMFSAIFFPKTKALVVWSLYILGILIAMCTGYLLSRVLKGDSRNAFIMELAPYRIPRFRNVFLLVWDKSLDFIKGAGTIILSVVLVAWFLSNMPYGVEYASKESLMGKLGVLISPIFSPLGFGEWRAAVALFFGFIAKEVVIGTFGTLYGLQGAALGDAIGASFTPLSAYSFLVFMLIYVPCMATVAVIKRETGSARIALYSAMYSVGLAWAVSFVIYRGGLLLGLS